VEVFLEREDWRALPGIQKEPTAMLGVAGLVAALTVFVLFGGWRTPTINAQTVQIAGQNSQLPAGVAKGSVPELAARVPVNSFEPIASHEVDLYGDSRTGNEKVPSPAPGLPNHNHPSVAAAAALAPSEAPALAVKRASSPVRGDERKKHVDAKSSSQLQALANSTQSESLTSVSTATSAAPESATISSEPSAAPEPVFEPAYTASQPIAGGDQPKTPKLYFEVGSFKDENWANNAVDKLTQLGFHAVLIHKNLLWSQSYHVQVGPYSNQKDFAEARQSLAAQGFKAHPVN
jgi:cell division protein FtsN